MLLLINASELLTKKSVNKTLHTIEIEKIIPFHRNEESSEKYCKKYMNILMILC